MGKHRKQAIRNEIGLSQEDYLPFLWVTRSQLAMYELNQRPMESSASSKDGLIVSCLYQPPTATALQAITLAEEKLETKDRAVYEKQLQACRSAIFRNKAKLEKMQQLYQQQINMLRVAATLPTTLLTLPQNDHHEKDVEWLELRAGMAEDKMETCSPGQQQLVELKLSQLQQEQDWLQQKLGN